MICFNRGDSTVNEVGYGKGENLTGNKVGYYNGVVSTESEGGIVMVGI